MKQEKIIETFQIDDYEIMTEGGWQPITHAHKTVPYDIWILKTKNFKLECADEHLVIDENMRPVFVKDLKIGDKIITENGPESVVFVQKTEADKENMYDLTVNSETHTFFSNGILSHNTTVMTIYCLWLACFQNDQRILLVANKEETAKEIFARIRLAYENLPNFLKPGVTEYGKTAMGLANGSRISISTTSSDAGRGSSVNVLVIDELAHIDNSMVETFWSAVYPIISSSKKSKIFVASTPNGTGNLFYQLYTDGMEGTNNWKTERVDWWEIPGRDDKWKENTIKSLGSRELFDQEFGNCIAKETILDILNNKGEPTTITIEELYKTL